MQQIVFVTALLDPNGGFVTHSGIFQVRTVVREGTKGNLAALTTPVEVRAR